MIYNEKQIKQDVRERLHHNLNTTVMLSEIYFDGLEIFFFKGNVISIAYKHAIWYNSIKRRTGKSRKAYIFI